MKGGKIVAEGTAADVVTEDLVRDVFGLDSRVLPDPISGTPLIIPLGRHHTHFPKAETATLELVP
jgi:iron complex transport system ATP-binding protein